MHHIKAPYLCVSFRSTVGVYTLDSLDYIVLGKKRQVTHQTIHEVHHGEEELTCQGLAAQNSKMGINISNMSMDKLFPGVFV